MEIRKATVNDCHELTELRLEMRKERETEISEDLLNVFYENTYRYLTENISNNTFISFIAIYNQEIIAMSGIYFIQFLLPLKIQAGRPLTL